MRIRIMYATLCALALIGCTRESQSVGNQPYGLAAEWSSGRGAPAAMKVAMLASDASTVRKNETLAYEHVVSVEIGKDLFQARVREVQDACNGTKAFSCTVLDFSERSDDSIPNASIRMRLAPTGVSALITSASKGGRIASRSTHAEDLAEPIADTERELALLTTHRDRLAEFMKSKDTKIDQLIVVSKELSSVQTQIDTLNSRRANLRRRVDTEVLTINLSLPNAAVNAEQTPIMDAVRAVGLTFQRAVANVIDFLAALLPWLVILVPGLILLRLFWRGIGRWLARRETR